VAENKTQKFLTFFCALALTALLFEPLIICVCLFTQGCPEEIAITLLFWLLAYILIILYLWIKFFGIFILDTLAYYTSDKMLRVIAYAFSCFALSLILLPLLLCCLFINASNLPEVILGVILYYCLLGLALRRWAKITGVASGKVSSWLSPRLFADIAIGLLYPLVFILYYSIMRFLRLGASYNILAPLSLIQISMTDGLILVLLYGPICIIGACQVLLLIRYLKDFVVHALYNVLYSIHLELLQWSWYFYPMEALYKLSVISFALLYGMPEIFGTGKPTAFQRFLACVYRNSYLLGGAAMTLLVVVETVINKGWIHYSLYLLFFYPIIFIIFSTLNTFERHPWADYCHYSDYLHKNFEKPRYPVQFWRDFEDNHYNIWPEMFAWELTPEEHARLEKAREPFRKKKHHGVSQLYKLASRPNYTTFPLCARLKVGYRGVSGVRWTHTSAIQQLHSHTGFFARTLPEQLALINQNWKFLRTIQHMAKRKPEYNPFPIKDSQIYSTGFLPQFTHKDLIGFLENNALKHFGPLESLGAKVFPYSKGLVFDNKVQQACPDVVIVTPSTNASAPRVLGVDIKSNSVNGIGYNRILIDTPEIKYNKIIDHFAVDLRRTKGITKEQQAVLDSLKASCNDFGQHQAIWLQHSHLFGDMLPPMRLPKTLHQEHMRPDLIEKINNGTIKMQKISEILKRNKIQAKKEPQYEDVEDIFKDAEIKDLMA